MATEFEILRFCSIETLISLFSDVCAFAKPDPVAKAIIQAIGSHVGQEFNRDERIQFFSGINHLEPSGVSARILVDAICKATQPAFDQGQVDELPERTD